MEYKLVVGTDSDTDSFNERVNEALVDGWELYGEPRVSAYFARGTKDTASEHVGVLIQAVVKRG
jgi:hypothetical protein